MLNNIKTLKNDKGFTIVELLIVIVVIAILAAITIVAYNGIQTRAKSSAAEALAANVAKKAEMYNAEPANSSYPATFAALTTPSTATYYVDSSSLILTTTALSSSTANPEKTIRYLKCGHSGTTTTPTTTAAITAQTGVKIEFWNNGALDAESLGTTSGYGNPPTNTFGIACIASTT